MYFILQDSSERPFEGVYMGRGAKKGFYRADEISVELPTLDYPQASEILYLYLAILDISLSYIPFRDEREIQRPIFYVSKSSVMLKEGFRERRR